MFRTLGKILKYPRLTLKYPSKPMDSSLFAGMPEIDHHKCNQCGECISRCPSSAITSDCRPGSIAVYNTEPVGSRPGSIATYNMELVSNKPGINIDECIFCGLCEDVCKSGAIKVSTKFEIAEKTRGGLRVSPVVIEERDIPGESYEVLASEVKVKISRVLGRSLQIREVDSGSCNACDYEINALNNPFNDIERFGIHFAASPRHADMLLVTGTASRNMELALIKTYNAAPAPLLVVAVGACACSGGLFRDNYASRNGIDCIVPVDAYIPGCPPRPQAILYGILKVLDRIK